MSTLKSIAAGIVCLAVVSSAAAAPVFTGDSFPWYGTPSGTGSHQVLNGAYPADLSSTLITGDPEGPQATRNEYTLTGLLGFSTPSDTPFAIADLLYHNGRTINWSPQSWIPVNVDVHFSSPSGVDRTLAFAFSFNLSLNTGDPVASVDQLAVSSFSWSSPFFIGSNHYSLELLGLSNDGGTTILHELLLAEECTTTSVLYARITQDRSGGDEPTVPEPAGLGLIGLALAAARKRRRA